MSYECQNLNEVLTFTKTRSWLIDRSYWSLAVLRQAIFLFCLLLELRYV